MRNFSFPWLPLALVASAQAITTIDTTPGDSYIAQFGDQGIATMGQTFVAPENRLSSFSFTLNLWDVRLTPFDFQLFVMDWNGSRADGSILYQSASMTAGFTGTDQTFVFAPNLSLTPGNDYVAFLSVSMLPGGPNGYSLMWMRNDDPYVNGSLVFFNNGYTFSALTTTTWDFTGDNFQDAAFVARFDSDPIASPVPETGSTWALLGLGLFGLVAARRKFAS